LAEKKQIELSVIAPQQPLLVRTDRRALGQILLNLTTNAIKFTERGSVRVELLRSTEGGGRAIEFAVIDTGIGIRLEDQRKLFQPFTRLGLDGEGTGLGLHLSQKLATLLGGRISCKSDYRRGSEFRLALPE
jgi:signal transduction histidine kinase